MAVHKAVTKEHANMRGEFDSANDQLRILRKTDEDARKRTAFLETEKNELNISKVG